MEQNKKQLVSVFNETSIPTQMPLAVELLQHVYVVVKHYNISVETINWYCWDTVQCCIDDTQTTIWTSSRPKMSNKVDQRWGRQNDGKKKLGIWCKKAMSARQTILNINNSIFSIIFPSRNSIISNFRKISIYKFLKGGNVCVFVKMFISALRSLHANISYTCHS